MQNYSVLAIFFYHPLGYHIPQYLFSIWDKIWCLLLFTRDVADVIEQMFKDDPPPIVMLGHRFAKILKIFFCYLQLII